MDPLKENVNPQSLKKKTVIGFLWQGGLSSLAQAINWGITIIVVRLLTPGDFGLMTMAAIFFEFTTMIGQLSLGSAVVQAPELKHRHLRQLLAFIIIANLLGWAAMFYGASLAAHFFQEQQLISILKTLSINFLLMSFYILPQSLLERNLDFRKKASVELLARTISSLVCLCLAFYGFGVWALVWGQMALHSTKAIAFNIAHPTLIWPIFSFDGMKKYLHFSIAHSGSHILFFFYSQSDRFVAGKVMGKDLLGQYSIALDLSSAPLDRLAPIISQVSFPAFSQMQTDIERVRRNVLKSVQLASFILFPLFYGMAAVAPYFIPIILGSKWATIVIPFQLICLILPLKGIDPFLFPAILGIGKPIILVGNNAIAFVMMGIAFLVGVKGGIIGLCLAWLTVYPLVFLLTTLRTARALGIPFLKLCSSMKFGAINSIIMAGSVIICAHGMGNFSMSIQALIALISLGMVTYALLAYAFDRQSIKEFKAAFKF